MSLSGMYIKWSRHRIPVDGFENRKNVPENPLLLLVYIIELTHSGDIRVRLKINKQLIRVKNQTFFT